MISVDTEIKELEHKLEQLRFIKVVKEDIKDLLKRNERIELRFNSVRSYLIDVKDLKEILQND